MRDQKLGYWLLTDLMYEFVRVPELKTQELRDPVVVFNDNAWHALHIATFPLGLVHLGQKLTLAHLAACHHSIGDLGLYNDRQLSPDEFQDVHRLAREILAGTTQTDVRLRHDMVYITDLTSFLEGKTVETFDTLMFSQLILSWTAFETLAGDLWEAAINAHPKTLATKASEGAQVPTVELSLLSKHGFNLEKKMGTVLREHRQNPFQTLRDIASNYQRTFPDGNAGSESFWSNKDVLAVSLLRNLIVHRGGRVDQRFVRDRHDDPRLEGPGLGDKFYLDGELLSQLVRGLFSFAKQLIQSVDGWIDRNSA